MIPKNRIPNNLIPRSWAIWTGIFFHLIWGTLVLIFGDRNLIQTEFFENNGGSELWAVLMIIGAILAMVGILFIRSRWLIVLTLVPQQIILTIGAISLILTSIGGSTILNTQVDQIFVIQSTIAEVLLAVFHNIAAVDYHWRGMFRKDFKYGY